MRLSKKKKKREGDEQWDSSVIVAEAMPVSTSCSVRFEDEVLALKA